jgi:hypothetical protein
MNAEMIIEMARLSLRNQGCNCNVRITVSEVDEESESFLLSTEHEAGCFFPKIMAAPWN